MPIAHSALAGSQKISGHWEAAKSPQQDLPQKLGVSVKKPKLMRPCVNKGKQLIQPHVPTWTNTYSSGGTSPNILINNFKDQGFESCNTRRPKKIKKKDAKLSRPDGGHGPKQLEIRLCSNAPCMDDRAGHEQASPIRSSAPETHLIKTYQRTL